jgi:hypothetical protein
LFDSLLLEYARVVMSRPMAKLHDRGSNVKCHMSIIVLLDLLMRLAYQIALDLLYEILCAFENNRPPTRSNRSTPNIQLGLKYLELIEYRLALLYDWRLHWSRTGWCWTYPETFRSTKNGDQMIWRSPRLSDVVQALHAMSVFRLPHSVKAKLI